MGSKRSKAFLAAGGSLVLAAAAALWFWPSPPGASATDVVVYKSPTCGCCSKWVKHMKDNGFNVKSKNVSNLSQVRQSHGVRRKLQSCHTAIVDGYVVEGHVPADVIKRLLKERPAVKGIAVPGMPAGSPGMEVGYKQPYKVLTFDKDGRTEVYTRR